MLANQKSSYKTSLRCWPIVCHHLKRVHNVSFQHGIFKYFYEIIHEKLSLGERCKRPGFCINLDWLLFLSNQLTGDTDMQPWWRYQPVVKDVINRWRICWEASWRLYYLIYTTRYGKPNISYITLSTGPGMESQIYNILPIYRTRPIYNILPYLHDPVWKAKYIIYYLSYTTRYGKPNI